MRMLCVSRVCAVGLMCLSTGGVSGQTYPEKPIRILTTVPGGSLDLTARLIAPGLGAALGQQVIVDNRGGVVSMELTPQAPPDGYTLLLASASLWISQFVRRDVQWNPVGDYAPITLAVTLPNVIAVHPSLPVKSVQALVRLARSRPGELNFASGQSGSSSHLAGELFKSMAGVNIVRVAYRGAGPSMVALITGETDQEKVLQRRRRGRRELTRGAGPGDEAGYRYQREAHQGCGHPAEVGCADAWRDPAPPRSLDGPRGNEPKAMTRRSA